jgi:hypothetical protein
MTKIQKLEKRLVEAERLIADLQGQILQLRLNPPQPYIYGPFPTPFVPTPLPPFIPPNTAPPYVPPGWPEIICKSSEQPAFN